MKNSFFNYLLFSFFFFLIVINCDNKQKLIVEHYNKGMNLAIQGNFDAAKTEFESALKMDSLQRYLEYDITIIDDVKKKRLEEDAAIHLFRGISYSENTEYDKAIKEIDQAILINPDHAILYNKRGIVYYYSRNYKKAIDDYNKSIELNPNLSPVYYNRALAYDDSGQKIRALKEYRLFLEKAIPRDEKQIQYARLRVEQLKGFAF